MTGGVRGEQPLPGATSWGPKATARRGVRLLSGPKEYLGLSVQQRADGTWRAMRMKLDKGTKRVVPTLLDGWEDQPGGMTPAEALLYWAQQLVLDEKSGRG